jgi:uncharacterized protein
MSYLKVVGVFVLIVVFLITFYFVVKSDRFLFWSIKHNLGHLARVSLSLGANPNAREGHVTALMESSKGVTSVVCALIGRGAVVSESDPDQRQAIHYAARNGQSSGAIVCLLIEHGADPIAPSKDGVTPLMEAASGLSGGTVMNAITMIAYANGVNQQDKEGNTALLIASTEADIVVVRALLRAGANPNIANHSGALPITAAASNGLSDRVRLLLDFGADPTLRENNRPSASDLVNQAAPNAELETRFREIAHLIEVAQARSHR